MTSERVTWTSGRITLDLGLLSHAALVDALPDGALDRAFMEMAQLEAGARLNLDEDREVGHYWLRRPQLAPGNIGDEIATTTQRIEEFAASVLDPQRSPRTPRWTSAIVVGVGGSSLGTRFVHRALLPCEGLPLRFIDNTDPDGAQLVFDEIGSELSSTLCVFVSKSGATREMQNGLAFTRERFRSAGLSLDERAVAVCAPGSQLSVLAVNQNWLAQFPIWEWVGGRHSVTSPAGLVPLALAGINIGQFLAGAAALDEVTRLGSLADNPAALLAGSWFALGDGRGARNFVLVPYRDRLSLLPTYLQQLVMESVGKSHDRHGRLVQQGLTVYGNKGSTDQHAYFQQLRDGPDDFFVMFVEVLKEPDHSSDVLVDDDTTMGDYLSAFLHGSRQALTQRGRHSLLLTLEQCDAWSVGALIAIFERSVGLYASMIDVNAYFQPGVEAGKKAADSHIALQRRLMMALRDRPELASDIDSLAARLDLSCEERETARQVLHRLRLNGRIA